MTQPWRLPSGVAVFERGWLSSNNVLFEGARTAIVDTGYAAHAQQTVALVRRSLGGRALDAIVNTHLHSDHCGGNAALQAAYPEARTVIPPGLADAVRTWDEDALTYASTGQVCERFAFDDVIRPGDEVMLGDARWQVHGAPGHDPHSVILFEPRTRTLISADALWENGFGVVFPELEGTSAFDEVAQTLDAIERLQPAVVVPGHGSVFGGVEAISAALSRARSRLSAFARDPARHGIHAAKVLIKFRLLEWQSIGAASFFAWAEAMPYMKLMHRAWFAEVPMKDWLGERLAELERVGALRRSGDMIYNI